MRLPSWHWAYVAFKAADGATATLLPLQALLHYDLPLWAVAATAAVMNLASVPASIAWSRIMAGGKRRRRSAVAGFAVAAIMLAFLAARPPFALYLVGCAVFAAFGVATAPAASTLLLEGLDRKRWAPATAALSRRTGLAFLTGMGIVVALGFAGILQAAPVFLAAGVASAGAAVLAARTIVPYKALHPDDAAPPPRHAAEVLRATGRRIERAVWFPARLRHPPRPAALWASLRSGPAPFLLAVTLLFGGTTLFLASYAGVLRDQLGLSLGLVLLAQLAAPVATNLTYAMAGRTGQERGERWAIGIGALLRMLALPALCATVLGAGAAAYPALLALQAVIGVSFAFLQVNAPCLLADHHPGGRGEGVGAYHAAVSMGVLMGSLVGFLLLFVTTLTVAYTAASAMVVLGCLGVAVEARRLRGAEMATPSGV